MVWFIGLSKVLLRGRRTVYLIYCIRCGVKCVGETRNSLATRMVQHRYNIRHRRETSTLLVGHFMLHGMDSVRVAGLQYNELRTDRDRKQAERQWIYRLNTREPWGLNLKCNSILLFMPNGVVLLIIIFPVISILILLVT